MMNRKIPSYQRVVLLLLVAVVVVAAVVTVHFTVAYVARKKTADNVFAVGLVELTVEEDSFPPDEDRWVVPKRFLPKNPHLVNTGSTNVFAFIEVVVPYEEVLLVADEGEDIHQPDPDGVKEQELFNLYSEAEGAVSGTETGGFTDRFTVTAVGEFTYHPDWVFIRSAEDTTAHTHAYLFGYRSVLTTEEGQRTTANVFDRIQLRNILEGSLAAPAAETIRIRAYGIQSDELKGELSVDDPTHLSQAELVHLYQYYLHQEG